MFYGNYKNARNASWQCLIDFGISELPVKTAQIAKQAGVKVVKNSIANMLQPHEVGKIYFAEDMWLIVYNDEEKIQRCRFTVAHELGHYFLGHLLDDGSAARSFRTDKPEVETEADVFASRLLAPACVLWGLDLHTPEDIARVCGISMTAARIRAERMEELYKRNKFLKSPLERQVFENFRDYIGKNKTH